MNIPNWIIFTLGGIGITAIALIGYILMITDMGNADKHLEIKR